MPDYFQIDLTQTQWRPSGLEALAEELTRSFESRLQADEVEFFGVDASGKKSPLLSDEAVRDFCSTGDAEQADAAADSRVLRVRTLLPERVAAEIRQPRRHALLAGGRQFLKYSTEAADVEFSLNFFDCGHFRLKEALGGASSSFSRGVVAEGRWTEEGDVEQDSGVTLEFLLSYAHLVSRRRQDEEITFQAIPAEARITFLQLDKGSTGRQQLKGKLPSSLTGSPEAEVELYQEADVVAKEKTSLDYDDDDWECSEALKAYRKSPPRPKPQRSWEDDWDSDEPRWPMYLGIFLFIVIFVVFAWLWYEEQFAPEAGKEFEEL